MELSTPITIYWDLPGGKDSSVSLPRTCAGIIACRPLMLHLRDPGPHLGEETVCLLELLKKEPISVFLTIPPTAIDPLTIAFLNVLGVKEILLSAGHVGDLASLAKLHRSGDQQPVMGVSFAVTRENLWGLPALFAFCRELGINRVVLPMQRLWGGEEPFHLDRRERKELAADLARIGGVEGMNLTIHDPFLWRACNPGVPFPQGGCQAANTMIAIAPDGGVFPCPSLPVRLGDAGETSLKEIVSSPARKEFRRRLLEMPSGCGGCAEFAECCGGCRGRGYVIHDTLDGADPSCGLLNGQY